GCAALGTNRRSGFAMTQCNHCHGKGETGLTSTDPVCGMTVDMATAKHRATHAGATYGFCSARCKERFEAEPERWLAGPSGSATCASAGADVLHICPMCEGVEQMGPGSCPKCGMALEPAEPVAATATRYTCPMHPEIVQDEPGSCPLCGMALEPVTVSVEAAPNPELVDFRRRFIIGMVLTVPVFVLAMGAHMFGLHIVPPQTSNWLQLVLSTPV